MNINIKRMVKVALVAAIYVALTLVFHPISFGSIQFRIAEALMLLVCYNKRFTFSLTIGCLISNIFSTVGMVDIVFGTMATFISCLLMILVMKLVKKRWIASIIPVIINGIIVGLELHVMTNANFFLSMATIMLGEFVVVCILGNILCSIFQNNEVFKKFIDDNE